MKKIILILMAVILTAVTASAQYNNVYVEGAPAFTAQNHTYDFKCGNKTLRMLNEGRPAVMGEENDYGGHFLVSLSMVDTKKPVYIRSIIDKRTGNMVSTAHRNSKRELQYVWAGDTATEYIFWNINDFGHGDCVMNKIDGRWLVDIGAVLYHFRAACPVSLFGGYQVLDNRKGYDVMRVEYSETDKDYTYNMTLSGNNHIRATFLKDGDSTPKAIDIRMPGLTAKGTLQGERMLQTAKLYPSW